MLRKYVNNKQLSQIRESISNIHQNEDSLFRELINNYEDRVG